MLATTFVLCYFCFIKDIFLILFDYFFIDDSKQEIMRIVNLKDSFDNSDIFKIVVVDIVNKLNVGVDRTLLVFY